MDSSTALQNQNTVSAYFASKQILPFGFARQNSSNVHDMRGTRMYPSVRDVNIGYPITDDNIIICDRPDVVLLHAMTDIP